MNHSSAPNIFDQESKQTVALRNIARGAELTCDYSEFEDPLDFLPVENHV